jgi:hypothetical protein
MGTLMSDRDELVTVIEGWANNWAGEIADAILARWRLVPVDRPVFDRWGGIVPVEEQHRAADEPTQHDQEAWYYGDTCQCGEGAEHSPRTHP